MMVLLLVQMAIVGLFLGGMLFVFLSNFASGYFGAPYVPMNRHTVKRLLSFGQLAETDRYYDLGSGDGRTLVAAARDFHVRQATGYERAPWPCMKSRFSVRWSETPNVTILNEDARDADLSDATFVYLYLFPKLVDRLATKFESELQKDARVLSAGFPIDAVRHPLLSLEKEGTVDGFSAYLYKKI